MVQLDTIRLAAGLIILIVVNIVLGSLSAMFHDSFNSKKFIQGFTKAGIVIVCFAATYLVGYMNPGIVAIEVNGVQVTVMTGIYLIVLVGYYHYAKQVFEKLVAIVRGNVFLNEVELFRQNGKNGGGGTSGPVNGSSSGIKANRVHTKGKSKAVIGETGGGKSLKTEMDAEHNTNAEK
jgi:hypothetical protein